LPEPFNIGIEAPRFALRAAAAQPFLNVAARDHNMAVRPYLVFDCHRSQDMRLSAVTLAPCELDDLFGLHDWSVAGERGMMADDDEVPEELADISPTRLKRWSELGLAQVKADLEHAGGARVVGGTAKVRQQAWRWVEYQEAMVKTAGPVVGAAPVAVPHDVLERIWGEDGYRVFLSHRSAVKKEVGGLKDRLEVFGARCFVAHREIHPTQDWQDEIVAALASMDCLVAVITDGFHRSEWTDQEIGYAIARGVPIIALKLGTDNPRGFVSRFQALTCEWGTAAAETIKITIKSPKMFEAYISMLRKCPSWDQGNILATALPGMRKLGPREVDALVAGFN
jgi:hypothetical protein